MKLTAYTVSKVWRQWDDVALWKVAGPTLTLWCGKGMRRADVELPREVIGLTDDGPVHKRRSSGFGATYTPNPEREHRPETPPRQPAAVGGRNWTQPRNRP